MKFDPRWDVLEEKFCKQSGHYESLFALGNGYLGTRGATEEDYRVRTPGTYLAGLFDEVPREVTELPNLPDWLNVEIELGSERFDLTQGEILAYRRVLHLYDGVLVRTVRWRSPEGRISKLTFQRFVSVYDQHLAGLKIAIVPENYGGTIRLTSRIDGQVSNSGTQHFAPVEASTFGERGIYLISESYQHKYLVVQGASHNVAGQIKGEGFANGPRRIDYWLELEALEGEPCVLEKLVTTYSSRDREVQETQTSQEILMTLALNQNLAAGELGFDLALKDHAQVWHDRWAQADVAIAGPDFDQLALRFGVFHLMQMASWDDYRVSVAAKGLSGEGYRGHVFWDTEIFIFPFFLYVFPEVARHQLRYRHYTLPGALRKAKENGYEGAMYAWESADTGDETTPTVGGIDFKTKKPVPILCGQIEQHITADIAYAIAHYLQVTGDGEFLEHYGAEIVLLGARFWASRVEYNLTMDCYEIKGVIGPDEYKEHVDNNYYTNALAKKHLLFAKELSEDPSYDRLLVSWGITDAEVEQWEEVARKLRLPREGDLFVQFDGFMELNEIDVVKYRDTPGWLQRVYSWREINEAQVLKQADVVMLLHLLHDELTPAEKRTNWDYYEPKTMHDSSLSAAIHSLVASDLGLSQEAYSYFQKASRIDLGNELQNSGHGLHAASLGGLWQATVHGFAGIRVKDQILHCNPHLPQGWSELSFKIQVGQNLLDLRITQGEVEISLLAQGASVQIQVGDARLTLDQSRPSATIPYQN